MEIESGLCSNYNIRSFILIYIQLIVSVTDLLNSPLSAHEIIGVWIAWWWWSDAYPGVLERGEGGGGAQRDRAEEGVGVPSPSPTVGRLLKIRVSKWRILRFKCHGHRRTGPFPFFFFGGGGGAQKKLPEKSNMLGNAFLPHMGGGGGGNESSSFGVIEYGTPQRGVYPPSTVRKFGY